MAGNQRKMNMLKLQNLLEKDSRQGGQKDGAKYATDGATTLPTAILHATPTLALFALRFQVFTRWRLQAQGLGKDNLTQWAQRQGLQQQ